MGYTFLRMSVTNSKEGEKYFLRSCLSLPFLFTRSTLSTGNSNVRTMLTSLVSNLVQGCNTSYISLSSGSKILFEECSLLKKEVTMPLDPVKNIFGIPSNIGSPEKCLLLIQNFS